MSTMVRLLPRGSWRERQLTRENSFNCLLPDFACKNFGHCNNRNGRCDCPPGFAGEDCLQPRTFSRLPTPVLYGETDRL